MISTWPFWIMSSSPHIWWYRIVDSHRNLQEYISTLRWRHNEQDGVSNHQPHDCLLNRVFRCGSKKTSTLHITGLCVGNSPVTGEFPTQRASNTENVSIWWRHHLCSQHEVFWWPYAIQHFFYFHAFPWRFIKFHLFRFSRSYGNANWPPYKEPRIYIHVKQSTYV